MTIDRAEVLRYLGHRGQSVDDRLMSQIDDAIAECMQLAAPLSLWSEHPLAQESGGLRVLGTTLLLPGADIARHLSGASACVLMSATLGTGIDLAVTRYQRSDLTRSLLLDAAATTLIEQICDEVEETVRQRVGAKGMGLSSRFSPGYGDLPLDIQPLLLDVLQAGKRMGLTCTPSLIMLPRKSVSAICGVYDGALPHTAPADRCAACSQRETCQYRKDGSACGY